MKGRWQRWVALWDRKERATSLAAARIGLSIVLLYDLGEAWARGLWPVLWGEIGRSDVSGPLVAAVCVVSAITFGLGLFTRASAVVLLLAYAQLARTLPDGDRGIDQLFRAALVIFAFSGAGATWSLDAKRKTGRFASDERVAAWPRYLLVVQLVWMYFSAANHKLQGPWTPLGGFSALYYVLQDPHFARFDFGWIANVYPLTQVATAMTMAFEWGAPLLLVAYGFEHTKDRPGRLRRAFNAPFGKSWARFRFAWIAMGASFHLALLVTMRLGIFPLGVLSLYPVFFSPEELTAVFRRGAVGRETCPSGQVDALH